MKIKFRTITDTGNPIEIIRSVDPIFSDDGSIINYRIIPDENNILFTAIIEENKYVNTNDS